MKLLGIRLCEHDSNLTYFDGKNITYIKTERIKGIKHHAYSDLISWQKDFNFKPDQIAIVLDPWRHNLPTNNENFFPAIEYNLPFKAKKIYRVNHHYAHALSSFTFGIEPEVHIVIDGFGDMNKAWTVFKDDRILDQGYLDQHGSIGIEMSRAGKWLGLQGSDYDLAGKVMALQAYGKMDLGYLSTLKEFSIKNINEIFSLDRWFKYNNGSHVGRLRPLDWIRTVHYKIEEVLVDFFSQYANKNTKISYTGGVALNIVWNTALRNKFKHIMIPPHVNDEGLSLGALDWLRRKNGLPLRIYKQFIKDFPYVQNDEAPKDKPTKKTIQIAANYINEGKIVGWYQGHGEIGPRALGNRSILCKQNSLRFKTKVNKIKKREEFRPFGGATGIYPERGDKYMLLTTKHGGKAIRHIDKTSRVQTVRPEDNKLFYELLIKLKELYVLNTSLNIQGKPICGKIQEAIDLFYNSSMDCLIVGNKIYTKKKNEEKGKR